MAAKRPLSRRRTSPQPPEIQGNSPNPGARAAWHKTWVNDCAAFFDAPGRGRLKADYWGLLGIRSSRGNHDRHRVRKYCRRVDRRAGHSLDRIRRKSRRRRCLRRRIRRLVCARSGRYPKRYRRQLRLLRRRTRPAEGRRRLFLTSRPVPQRLAGYKPAAPVEIGRVPSVAPREAPTPTPALPPREPGFSFPPYRPLPVIHIPPVFITPDPPVKPPKEPPVDVPEPGVLFLLAAGALTYRLLSRKSPA